MLIALEEVVDAALQLSDSDRAAVVERLLDSLSGSDDSLDIADPEFQHELETRLSDNAGSIPWTALRDEV